ncbi:MAG: DM13 domain-containing protein [Methyloligellaceae bacterium]
MTLFLTKLTAAFTAAVTALFIVTVTPAFSDEVLGQGTFVGKSNHVTTGTASLVKAGSGAQIRFAANFKLDGAPDPWVGFGSNGKYVKATQLAKLKSNNGAQTYAVPATIDVSKYNEIYVWCSKAGVPLGVAKIK